MKDFDILAYLNTCGSETQRRINGIHAAQDMLAVLRREARPMRAGEINNILMKENVHGYKFYAFRDDTISGYPYYSTQRCVQQARKLAQMGLVAIEKIDCEPYDLEILLDWKWVDNEGWVKDPDGNKKIIHITNHTYYRAI